MDDATIARLPQLVADAPRHTGGLDNAKLTTVYIRRKPGQLWNCGNVEIDVSFDSGCSAVYKNHHGETFLDCPRSEVFYDTSGKLSGRRSIATRDQRLSEVLGGRIGAS